ncbi:MAG: Ca2+-dependent phosphoinositide-specific phospholipase C [Limisphaerales bacterium]
MRPSFLSRRGLGRFVLQVGSIGLLSLTGTTSGATSGVRLDQCQVIGTHNSYHVAPGPVMDALIRRKSASTADSLAYTHRPLREQLGTLGIRQLELDLVADPDGGRFAEPRGPKIALEESGTPTIPHDPEGVLRQPGLKIIHVPDVDFLSRNLTFKDALIELRDWSAAHPFHFPVLVLLELKEDSLGSEFTPVSPFTVEAMAGLEREIRETLPARQRFEPDQLRGSHATLRDAVKGRGWPEVSALLGKFIFALDNEGRVRDRYIGDAMNLGGKALFVSVPRDHPAAAWMKINDPIGRFDEIQELVREGFLVRTRADAGTVQARTNDGSQRDRALASGAQFVSTDYPEPNLSFSPYLVRLPGGYVARANPVTGGGLSSDRDMEAMALETPAIQVRLGELAHQRRCLGEASGHYARALALDPSSPGTPDDVERAKRLAPVLLIHPEEPFRLRDVAVVIHPERPWLGYHLFWEDDLDFPEDNDPCDHEVIWVEFDPATGRNVAVHTYFHSRILSRPLEGEAPRVAVEWGKHGSIPVGSDGRLSEIPPTLRSHWSRLNSSGRRLADHALGVGWPRRFEGDFTDYLRFEVPVALRERIEAGPRPRIVRSRWPNAVLNQEILPYNFAAKQSWPTAPE